MPAHCARGGGAASLCQLDDYRVFVSPAVGPILWLASDYCWDSLQKAETEADGRRLA